MSGSAFGGGDTGAATALQRALPAQPLEQPQRGGVEPGRPPRRWDRLVVDSAPTGHMLGRHDDEPDPLLARLHQRRDRMEQLHRRLRSDATVHLVLVPERLAWAETVRAADSLTAAGMRLGAPVVNRVVPPGESGLLAARRAQQDAVLVAVRQRFAAAAVVEVPLLGGELTGATELGELVALLERAGW